MTSLAHRPEPHDFGTTAARDKGRTVCLGYFRPAGSVAPLRSETLGSGRVGSGGEGAVWAEGFLSWLSSPTSYVSQRDNDAANLNKKPD